MVAVVGRLFQKWFPAQPNLSYTYIWDKTDAYGQRVYGLSEAVGEFRLSQHQPLKAPSDHPRESSRLWWWGFSDGWGGFRVIHMRMSGFNTPWLKLLHRLLNKRNNNNNIFKDGICCVLVSVKLLLTTEFNSHIITHETKWNVFINMRRGCKISSHIDFKSIVYYGV